MLLLFAVPLLPAQDLGSNDGLPETIVLSDYAAPAAADATVVLMSQSDGTEVGGVEDVANQVLEILLDGDGKIDLPDKVNVASGESWFQLWMFIYALLTPIGFWVFAKFFPSSKKSNLIIKATSFAILVLVIFFSMKAQGVSIEIVGKAAFAFIMQIVTYDKLFKPLGLKSPRLQNYDRTS